MHDLYAERHAESETAFSEADHLLDALSEVRSAVIEAAGANPVAAAMARLETQLTLREETRSVTSQRAAEARMKGYQGDACGNCGNFTLVRNGTCLKCDTCGSTSGCS